jgi:hypothetical protein
MEERPVAGDTPPHHPDRRPAGDLDGRSPEPGGEPLSFSPITVLEGVPSDGSGGVAVPGSPAGSVETAGTGDLEAPGRPRPRTRPAADRQGEEASPPARGRSRRTGIALAAVSGVVVLAAAPFAVISPRTQLVGEPASSAAKAHPKPEAKKPAEKQAGKRPVMPVPVPAPSWQTERPSQPPDQQPPVRSKPAPPETSPPETAPPAEKEPPSPKPVERPSRQEHQRTHERRSEPSEHEKPTTHTKSPAAAHLVVTPHKKTDRPAPTARKRAEQPHTTAVPDTEPPATTEERPAETKDETGETRVVQGTYVLNPGDEIRTDRLSLALQTDGDLVLRDEDDTVTWSTDTHVPDGHAVFQADGNLVLYSSDDETLWSSQTDGHDGAVLVLQADGTLAIRQGDTTLWTAG